MTETKTDDLHGSTASGCPFHHGGTATSEAQPKKKLPQDALESASAVSRGDGKGTTAILLVNHGSRAPIWRRLLLDVQAQTAQELLTIPGVSQVRTAYMEYTEPSIASQLKEFDAEGITDVLVVPLLLTVSDHSLDDIPAICGQSGTPELIAQLTSENIEIYKPKAHITFAPLLDFSGIVRANVARRIRTVMDQSPKDPGQTGLVLVGYGSGEFDDEWNSFFEQIGEHAKEDLKIADVTHAWCGHLVDYSKQPTVNAINKMLDSNSQVVVLPQLVSYDPMFQERIIGRAVRESKDPARVLYSADSILPEPQVGDWVIRISRELLSGGQPN